MCVLNVLSLSFLVTNGHENLVSQGIVPFDSHYYKYLGRCARIPGVECDTIKMDTTGRHVVILKNGRYFKLEVLDKKGRIASPRQLKERLQYILNLAGDEEDERYIAALTAQERTTWAKQRNILEQDEDNKATLEAIDSALFVVSMENSNPADHQDYCRRTFHGSGRNVWFDKCFTMLIFPNGYYSNNVEHSALDATVFEHLLEGAVIREEYDDGGYILDKGEPDLELEMPKELCWNFDKHEDFLEEAREYHLKQVEDSDLCVFHTYGKRIPKSCKISPDGWMQMAIQITWYRLQKSFVLTYEAATTRMFYKGRTETIRPVSVHSCNFVKAFDNPSISNEEKRALLLKAIDYQETYKFKAMRGFACDRHLFGLYLMAKYTKMNPLPTFLQGNAFAFRLSTSQTPTNSTRHWCLERCGDGGGFGTVMDNGYGVSYMFIGEDRSTHSIHSKKSCPKTDSELFGQTMMKTLDEMREMFKL
jgi:carnitine O-palmitoyltransferase 1